MIEEQRKKLEHIKDYFREGTYNILSKIQWDEFSRDLSSCGASFLKEIEQKRDEVRKLEISFLFLRKRRQLIKLNSDYDAIAKDFDLFFDAGMRWLRSIIEGDKYAEYQVLQRKYFEGLLSHCRQALDYLGNLISSKRKDYFHYQMIFWAVLAVFVASLSIGLSIIFRIWS
jgi:hypothetical protein